MDDVRDDVSFYFPKCFDNGIKFINDITKEDGKLMTFQEASVCLNSKLNYLQYLSMCNAIREWQKVKINKYKEKFCLLLLYLIMYKYMY